MVDTLIKYRTNLPGVDLGLALYKVQDQFKWGILSLGSRLGINQFSFRTKSLGVDLY